MPAAGETRAHLKRDFGLGGELSELAESMKTSLVSYCLLPQHSAQQQQKQQQAATSNNIATQTSLALYHLSRVRGSTK